MLRVFAYTEDKKREYPYAHTQILRKPSVFLSLTFHKARNIRRRINKTLGTKLCMVFNIICTCSGRSTEWKRKRP